MSVFDGQSYHQNMVHYVRADITFSDVGTVVSLGWVPKGAVMLRGGVVVSTEFNAATTNTLDIGFRNAGDGTSDDADSYATSIATGTAGVINTDEMATTANAYLPSGAEITASPKATGAAATAGVGQVWMEYLIPNDI